MLQNVTEEGSGVNLRNVPYFIFKTSEKTSKIEKPTFRAPALSQAVDEGLLSLFLEFCNFYPLHMTSLILLLKGIAGRLLLLLSAMTTSGGGMKCQ